jgi:membrane protein
MRQRLRAWADGFQIWLEEHRSTRVARGAITGFIAHDVLQYAGAMAYFTVLSMVNLLVLGVVALTFVVGEGAARQFVVDRVSQTLPLAGADVGRLIDRAIDARGSVTIIGVVLLVWSALGVFGALSGGISRVFTGTPRRPFWKERAIGLALLAATGVVAIASVALGFVTQLIQDAVSARVTLPGVGPLFATIGLLVSALLIFVSFLVVYRVVPTRPLPLRHAIPGALVATLLWTILRIGFVFYATRVAKYDTVFGPIGTAVSLLVFLYFSSVVLLFGAEVSRASAQEIDPDRRPAEEPVLEPLDLPGETQG